MKLFINTICTVCFALLGSLGVMLAANNGLAPCSNCRALLTPNQGGLIYLQAAGLVGGGPVGIATAWWINRRSVRA